MNEPDAGDDAAFARVLDGWEVPAPRDLWPGIEARLDDPLRALVEEVRALRAEVAALRRVVAGRGWPPAPVRLPESDWIGKERV